jgi:hypothetical protein
MMQLVSILYNSTGRARDARMAQLAVEKAAGPTTPANA